MTEDVKVFGESRWVYCESHVRPHLTGWCTVCSSKKRLLTAVSRDEAYKEARSLGFSIIGENG